MVEVQPLPPHLAPQPSSVAEVVLRNRKRSIYDPASRIEGVANTLPLSLLPRNTKGIAAFRGVDEFCAGDFVYQQVPFLPMKEIRKEIFPGCYFHQVWEGSQSFTGFVSNILFG